MMKKLTGFFGAILIVCAMAGISQAAVVYNYYDPGYGINYELSFTGGAGNTFTLSGPTNTTDLFAAAFNFKFSANDTWVLSDLDPTTISGDTWDVADGDTQVFAGGGKYQTLLNDNRVGFYNVEASTGDPLSIASVEVNEGFPQVFSFTLAQTTVHGLDPVADLIAFKVLYITNDGETAQFQGWLSKELKVPEAGAIMLFGTGLVALVGYRRVKRMM